MAAAPAIEPTRTFFNAMRARNISVFFITARRNSQRDATLLNLDHVCCAVTTGSPSLNLKPLCVEWGTITLRT
jgi:hypothetical protein